MNITKVNVCKRVSDKAEAATIELHNDEAAAVLIALAVLPAFHFRAGEMISLTTESRYGANIPCEFRVELVFSNIFERIMKDFSLLSGSFSFDKMFLKIVITRPGK